MIAQKLQQPVYLVDAVRTPIGSPFKSLKDLTAVQLASLAIKEVFGRSAIPFSGISEVILGNAVSAGVGQNCARSAALSAGLPENIPACTVNSVCGSGLQAVILSVQSILAGAARLSIAGGAESATHAPYLLEREEEFNRLNPPRFFHDFKDSIFLDGLYCQMTNKCMGEIMEALIARHKISREEQDRYALESHRRAILARQENVLDGQIVSVEISAKDKVVCDDRPRNKLKIENLSSLPPAFAPNGTITAGNASVPCDGAAVVLMASKQAVQEYGLKPKARIVGYAHAMLAPELTFEADAAAIEACLKICGVTVPDIDVFEIGEAFAAQCLLLRNQLNLPVERMNMEGGDIAIGHPLGAAGARVLTTLVHTLEKRQWMRGMAGICFGGGGALAMMVERTERA